MLCLASACGGRWEMGMRKLEAVPREGYTEEGGSQENQWAERWVPERE